MPSPLSRLAELRELSGSRKTIVGVVAVAVILAVVVFLLSQSGVIGGADSLSGYYALQVNPASNSAPTDPFGDVIFGFDRFALNPDRTFRLGGLRGSWRRSGSSLALNPTNLPKPGEFYDKTSMAQALTILLKPSEFKISANEKTLTAANPTNGPVVFVKTTEIFR